MGEVRGCYQLEEIRLVEGVECPQNILTERDLLLAAPDVCEGKIQQQSPKFSGSLLAVCYACDEEVFEGGVPVTVEGEPCKCRSIGEGRGACRPCSVD